LSTNHKSAQSTDFIRQVLESEDLNHYGIAQLEKPLSIDLYQDWLKQGFQGEMQYLERHFPEKSDPQLLMKRAQSAIVVTVDYVAHPAPLTHFPLSAASRIAFYAKGQDYHHFLKNKLNAVVAKLKEHWPEEEFLVFTDSSPVLERDLAYRAGLGWVGKNTCLINRQSGSLFFIAEIYSSLNLPVAQITSPDHCGTCTRCLDACPTGALTAPRQLDARLCISYLTIEARDVPPEHLRKQMGDWLFGCDICQTVCPWNKKAHGESLFPFINLNKVTDVSHKDKRREIAIADLQFILNATNRGLEKAFLGTPLMRTGAVGLKRNALVVAANLGAHELTHEIKNYLNHPKLSELAIWTLSQII
jgi:epoxyqueuosine reductase